MDERLLFRVSTGWRVSIQRVVAAKALLLGANDRNSFPLSHNLLSIYPNYGKYGDKIKILHFLRVNNHALNLTKNASFLRNVHIKNKENEILSSYLLIW
jgi:hypothetical protein